MSESGGQIFNFDDAFATLFATNQASGSGSPSAMANEADLAQALKASGEAAYRWNIETDEIVWSNNVSEVLNCHPSTVSTGRLFASLMDTENVTSRYETVMNSKARDDGRGVPFQIEYLFRSQGRKNTNAIWLEDVGRWQAGLDGLPSVVFGTVRRIDERHKREQHLTYLGSCDPLTGMMNRARMTDALGEAINGARKSGSKCAFAIAAINNLPLVNDAYGFDVADEVIVAAGRRLRQVMRLGDGIGRYSGGKFGIILNECDESELAIALRRFMSSVRDSVIETGRGPVWVTLSIGAVLLPQHAETPAIAASLAEEALADAFKQSAEEFVIYKPSERRANQRQFNAVCATEIVKCLREEHFRLAFQPVVDAKTGNTAFHEALLRMQDATSGEMIAAAHLIPVAELLGLVRLVDRAVMQLTVKNLLNHPQARLSMNVSGTTAADPFWYGQLLDVITANPGVAQRLTMEISEAVLLKDMKSARRFMERLRQAGCSVAVDGFGTGYTAFRSLRELPVDILKIDGSFCRNLVANTDNEYMLRSLIDLAHKFNFKTVAERVETAPDAEALTSWGIDYLQGHHFGEATVVAPWETRPSDTFEVSILPQPESAGAAESPISPESAAQAEAAPIAALEAVATVEVKEPAPQSEATPVVIDEAPVTAEENKPDAVPAPIMDMPAPATPPAAADPVAEKPVASETITVEAALPPAPAPEAAHPDAAFDLDFSGIDDSIARLREALNTLTQNTASASEAEETTEQEPPPPADDKTKGAEPTAA